MSTTEFLFVFALMFGVIRAVVGGLLAVGHRLHASATGRRRAIYGIAIKGFQRDTARNLLIFGCILLVTGVLGILATR